MELLIVWISGTKYPGAFSLYRDPDYEKPLIILPSRSGQGSESDLPVRRRPARPQHMELARLIKLERGAVRPCFIAYPLAASREVLPGLRTPALLRVPEMNSAQTSHLRLDDVHSGQFNYEIEVFCGNRIDLGCLNRADVADDLLSWSFPGKRPVSEGETVPCWLTYFMGKDNRIKAKAYPSDKFFPNRSMPFTLRVPQQYLGATDSRSSYLLRVENVDATAGNYGSAHLLNPSTGAHCRVRALKKDMNGMRPGEAYAVGKITAQSVLRIDRFQGIYSINQWQKLCQADVTI